MDVKLLTGKRRMDAIIPRLCAMYAAQPLVMAPAEPAKRHAHNPDGEAWFRTHYPLGPVNSGPEG